MDFGGCFLRTTAGLEVMRCREGSVFSYARGIGDPGTRWAHAQAAAVHGQIEPWHARHLENLRRLRSRQAHQCPQTGDMLLCYSGVCRWR